MLLDYTRKRSGAGRKLSERERSGERVCEKNDGTGAERGTGTTGNGNGAVSGLNWPVKFPRNALQSTNSIIHVKNKLSTGILIPIGLYFVS